MIRADRFDEKYIHGVMHADESMAQIQRLHTESETLLREALTLDPAHGMAGRALALLLIEKEPRDNQDVESVLSPLLEANPADLDALLLMARRWETDNPATAIFFASKAIGLLDQQHPSADEQALLSGALTMLAQCQLEEGDAEEAVANLKKANELGAAVLPITVLANQIPLLPDSLMTLALQRKHDKELWHMTLLEADQEFRKISHVLRGLPGVPKMFEIRTALDRCLSEELRPGRDVTVVGLTSAEGRHLNGRGGVLQHRPAPQHSVENGRVAVRVAGQLKSMKVDNVQVPFTASAEEKERQKAEWFVGVEAVVADPTQNPKLRKLLRQALEKREMSKTDGGAAQGSSVHRVAGVSGESACAADIVSEPATTSLELEPRDADDPGAAASSDGTWTTAPAAPLTKEAQLAGDMAAAVTASTESAETDVDAEKIEAEMLQVAFEESEESAFDEVLEASELAALTGSPANAAASSSGLHAVQPSPAVAPPPDACQQAASSSASPFLESRPSTSQGADVYPTHTIAYSSLSALLQGTQPLPSIGTAEHGAIPSADAGARCTCFPCRAFHEGGCPRGHGCLRCHAEHDEDSVPRGGGRARQRKTRLGRQLGGLRSPEERYFGDVSRGLRSPEADD